MRSLLTRLAGLLFLALLGLGLTAATPGVARAASGHSHCEEAATPTTATEAPGPPAATALRGTDAPCGSCPESSCATHLLCLTGSVIALGASRPSTAAGSSPSAPTVLDSAPVPLSIDQSPPTPPPNAFPVR